MQKTIAKVDKMAHGHLMLEFTDGSKRTVFRGDHEAHNPQKGDLWPPEGHDHAKPGTVATGALRRVPNPPLYAPEPIETEKSIPVPIEPQQD